MLGLNICIDIDGTLTDPYYWIDEANKYFQKSVRPEHVTAYEIHKVLNVSPEEYIEFYEMYGERIHGAAIIREHVKEVLDNFRKRHNLYYVTAREAKMDKVSKEWIQKHQLPCDGLFLLGSHYKVDKALELQCDVFLEDNYQNALQLAQAGFQVLLLDTYYNRYPLPNGVVRVNNWLEIQKIIENLSLERSA
ncbi:MAG: 5' nucleotidase, NT5C type [Bacillota bacterium]